MADFVFNIAKGRVGGYYDRVNDSDPANSVLVAVAINTSALDATLLDLDTLALVLADGDTAELANTGYARIVMDDSDLAAQSPDDGNDRSDFDIPDLDFGAITDDDVDFTDILICFDPDSTGGDDTTIIPLCMFDFEVEVDGSSIVAQVNAAGFFRAS